MPSSGTRRDQTWPPRRDFQRWRASERWHGTRYTCYIDIAKTFIDVNCFGDDSNLRPDAIYEGANQP